MLTKSRGQRMRFSARRLVSFLLIVSIMVISASNIPWPPTQAAVPSTLNIAEWNVPSGNAGPAGINVDSTGRVWFAENQTGKLGMLDPVANKIYEWNLLSGSSVNSRDIFTSSSLTYQSASFRAYFAEYTHDKIAYLDTTAPTPTVTTTVTSTTTIITSTTTTNTANFLTEWQLPAGSKPASIFVDDQGNIWFTDSGSDDIGELIGGSTTNSQFIEWDLPGGNPGAGACGALCVWGLYVQNAGSDYYVWFTERTGGNADAGLVGRLQLSNNLLTTWDLNTLSKGVYQPVDIAVDSAGNAYFSNYLGNRISILNPVSGAYREFALGTAGEPVALTLDQARTGLLWFLEFAGNNIAYLNYTATGTSLPLSASQCTIPSTITITNTYTGGPTAVTTNNHPLQACVNGALQNAAISMSTTPKSVNPPQVANQGPSSRTLGGAQALTNGISEYSLPSANSRPYGVTLDSNDNLWLTESDNSANRIAEVQLPSAADFSIQLTSPAQVAVSQGGEYAYLINVNAVSGSQSQVSLSVNAPSGLTAKFYPSIPLIPPFQSVLTITTMVSTPPSTYVMIITATSSSATHSLCIALTVLSTGPVTSTVSSISSQSSVACPVSTTSTTSPSATVTLTTTIYSISQAGGYEVSTYAEVSSNSMISALQFDSSRRLLNFTATGPPGTIGETKVVIAKTLLDGTPVVIIDDGKTPLLSLTVSTNSTHYTIDFTYPHSSHTITVGGQNTIPEFPTTLPALVITLLFITLGVRVRRKGRVFKTTSKN